MKAIVHLLGQPRGTRAECWQEHLAASQQGTALHQSRVKVQGGRQMQSENKFHGGFLAWPEMWMIDDDEIPEGSKPLVQR